MREEKEATTDNPQIKSVEDPDSYPDIIHQMYRQFLSLPIHKKISEFIAEQNPRWVTERRKEYLMDVMQKAVEQTFGEMDYFDGLNHRGRVLEAVLTSDKIKTLVAKIAKLQTEIYLLKKPTSNRITDDDIRRAREYPFEELYEFRHGMALCPFHDDHSPSFSLHNNKATCFGACGRTWDTIAFLMDYQGLSFVDAVRRLQR
jgi:hypothetical protein